MFIEDIKALEKSFLDGENIDIVEMVTQDSFLDKLSLDEIIEITYFLNHLVYEAFPEQKYYNFFALKVDLCTEYLKNRFSCTDFATIDRIWFWHTIANMTFDLTYQYEKADSIMRWILTTNSKTKKQEQCALNYLIHSQLTTPSEREFYEKLYSSTQI